MEDKELLEYISESCTMSKSLEEYGGRKSTATTTARRLADFLGADMVKDKGLACSYIIAKHPAVRGNEGGGEGGTRGKGEGREEVEGAEKGDRE